jgi:hypothetical protein
MGDKRHSPYVWANTIPIPTHMTSVCKAKAVTRKLLKSEDEKVNVQMEIEKCFLSLI